MNSPTLPILGAGESGLGAARLALQNGFVPWVSDSGPGKEIFREEMTGLGIAFECDGHSTEHILDEAEAAGFAIKSPGIPESNALVVAMKKRGISVISEIEFASRFARKTDEQIIAITGANGKTTTTALVAARGATDHRDRSCSNRDRTACVSAIMAANAFVAPTAVTGMIIDIER